MLGQFKGEFAALSAAFLWAVAAIFYGRATQEIASRPLNLLKGILAMSMLGLTLILTGEGITAVEPQALTRLLLSGILRIGLGDTAYFEALKALGPRRALLLGVLAPPLTAIIAMIFLGEQLPLNAWLGIALTVSGVTWVISEQENSTSGPCNTSWRGIGFGLLAAVSQSVGAVLSRVAFTSTTVSPLWSALIRLAAGFVIVLLWGLVAKRGKSNWTPLKTSKGLWAVILTATFLGTYLGIWLQQISLKFTQAGTAQTLLATSQLFILPIAAWKGETISIRAVLGAVIALCGVALLFGLI